MDIRKKGTIPPGGGPANWFTGSVLIQPIHSPPEPARAQCALVSFEPGARTAWHSHPLGQTLFVVAGHGWVQREGAARQDVAEGDVVWFPPGERHWHGATATSAMSHIAIHERLNGSAVDWMELVRDSDYSNPKPNH